MSLTSSSRPATTQNPIPSTNDLVVDHGMTSEKEGAVIINYCRPDGDYSDWEVWLWDEFHEGRSYVFNGKWDLGVRLVLDRCEFRGMIGFVMKMKDWSEKDVDEDRFFVRKDRDDTEIFVFSGESDFYCDSSQVPKTVKRNITAAVLVDGKTIEVMANSREVFTHKRLATASLHQGNQHVLLNQVKRINGVKCAFALPVEIDYRVAQYFDMTGFNELKVTRSRDVWKAPEFVERMTYKGELGAIYGKEATMFLLWAPFAANVELHTYRFGCGDNAIGSYEMKRMNESVFEFVLIGDCHGLYYDYSVTNYGRTVQTHDPYAKASGVNSVRSMVVDFGRTNPCGWENDRYVHAKEVVVPQTDAIIYELHVRDLSMSECANIKNRGKYLGFTELGTKTDSGELTGLSHVRELGVNYIHLMPVYDFGTVDETTNDGFNWGYDPVNYSVPEGSYATDAFDGVVRIKEFKQMVQAIHKEGIGVVMDVVYNHTLKSIDSHFNLVAPGYYYRMNQKGEFSNGSGCGNEIASDCEMVKRYIIDSVAHWANEYHIDGFRFDLMGLLDIKLMNEIRAVLDQINPNIIIYGEGWTAGMCALPFSHQANKANALFLDNRIACFCDDIRDGVKGSVFEGAETGYISGKSSFKSKVMFGIAAATQNIAEIKAWAKEPTQVVTYVSAHDNYTLFDKICLSAPQNATEEDRIALNMLAAAIILSSQGMIFVHAGEEMLRTKPLEGGGFDENSYKSGDAVNMLDWKRKSTYRQVFEYYQGLIALRKAHPEFRYATTREISDSLHFIETEDDVIAYTLANRFVVLFNPYNDGHTVTLPDGVYQYYVNKTTARAELFGDEVAKKIVLQPLSATILGRTH